MTSMHKKTGWYRLLEAVYAILLLLDVVFVLVALSDEPEMVPMFWGFWLFLEVTRRLINYVAFGTIFPKFI